MMNKTSEAVDTMAPFIDALERTLLIANTPCRSPPIVYGLLKSHTTEYPSQTSDTFRAIAKKYKRMETALKEIAKPERQNTSTVRLQYFAEKALSYDPLFPEETNP